MEKITFEDIDDFKNVISGNHFEKYKVLHGIKEIDSAMEFQEPGEYRITITIEKTSSCGRSELLLVPLTTDDECKRLKELIKNWGLGELGVNIFLPSIGG